jgi:hypothetical protein
LVRINILLPDVYYRRENTNKGIFYKEGDTVTKLNRFSSPCPFFALAFGEEYKLFYIPWY